jgi:hypothetical protein
MTSEDEVRERLRQLIDLDFERTSLDNVLKYISEVQKGLNIVIDPDISTAGIDLATRVVDLRVTSAAIELVLSLILGADLAYKVQPGYVLITTREKLQQNLEMHCYTVHDLVCPMDELIDVAQRTVNNMSDPNVAAWTDEGGPASVEYLNGVLVVTQTEAGHHRLGALLHALRTSNEPPLLRFPPGRALEAWQALRDIVQSAKERLWIEDKWLGSDVVDLLGENLSETASLRVLGPDKTNPHWNGALASLRRLGQDRPQHVEVRCTTDLHDRYVYADGHVWRCSDSFKDMARNASTKLTAETLRAKELIGDFEKRWSQARKEYGS